MTRTKTITLSRIERRTWWNMSGTLRADVAGHGQQARAQRQAVAVDRLEVDLETHATLVDHEVDHAPLFERVVALGDDEHRALADRAQHLRRAVVLAPADEQEVDVAGRGRVLDPAHEHRAAGRGAPADQALEVRGQGIVAQHADD